MLIVSMATEIQKLHGIQDFWWWKCLALRIPIWLKHPNPILLLLYPHKIRIGRCSSHGMCGWIQSHWLPWGQWYNQKGLAKAINVHTIAKDYMTALYLLPINELATYCIIPTIYGLCGWPPAQNEYSAKAMTPSSPETMVDLKGDHYWYHRCWHISIMLYSMIVAI